MQVTDWGYFNTSNVTIQPCPYPITPHLCHISIHLMLLFNKHQGLQFRILLNFNTSNVTIQRKRYPLPFPPCYISIHLMLLFNLCLCVLDAADSIISIHLMLLFNCEGIVDGLNTMVFQYI